MEPIDMEPVDTDDNGWPTWVFGQGSELPGDTLAMERLGVGGRWETWLVWCPRLWSPAVLKVARPRQSRLDSAVKTLRREVVALTGNLHPALPRLLADGCAEPVPYILVEYVDGPALDEEICENGPLDPAEAALVGAQLLPAIAALHNQGLAHLDLKSANVVLRESRPVLIDFGTAAEIGSRQPAGRPVGTEGYVAPEQEACAPVSAAMDLYGLGMILAEAVTGVPRAEGAEIPASALGEIIHRLRSDDPAGRGTDAENLVALAAATDTRPWPAWLDRHAAAAFSALPDPENKRPKK